MPRSVQETSALMGNYIVEYAYVGRQELRRTPMIGYYRCWAASAESARENFCRTQRYYRNECCNVLNVWRKAEVEA